MKAQQHHSWVTYIIPPIILSLITWIIYYPSLHYEFQFDDIANITKHFDIRYNTFSALKFSGSRWISYWLNAIHYHLGKFDPFSYRVGNVLIHISNGLLVFFIVCIALSNLKKENFFKTYALFISCLTSLLFLIHPVQTQTVSYVIQGELEGLSTLAILTMILCLLTLFNNHNKAVQYVSGIFLFVVAAFSTGTKEIAIISPVLLVLIDWFFIAQGQWQSFKKRIWLYSVISIFIIGTYLWLLKASFFAKIFAEKKNNIGNILTESPEQMITAYDFLISQFKVILHYIWMFIWPFSISVEYDWLLARSFFAPDCLFPFLLLLAGVAYLIRHLYKNPANIACFGAVWFMVCMAPRASIIPSPELVVDYKTYMASFGIFFCIASALVLVVKKLAEHYKNSFLIEKKWSPMPLCLLLATVVGFATVQRNKVWRSGLEFWENIIENAPGKARAYNNYGVELSQKLHKFAAAVPYFQKAIFMDSKYPDPCNNLAVAYCQLGKMDEAVAALRQGIAINPYYPEGYNNLASFLIQKKDYDQAEKALEIALKLRPYYGKAYFNMGRIYLERGNTEKAWQYFKDSCTKADLDIDIGFATYAKVSLSLKKYDDAIYGFKKALEINPYLPEAKFNLANTYYLMDNFEQAIALYQEILASTPAEHRVIYNLGEAYLKANQPTNALNCFQKLSYLKDQLPALPIRMAACHHKLGQTAIAKQELVDLTKDTKAPEEVKSAARTLLAQFNVKGQHTRA